MNKTIQRKIEQFTYNFCKCGIAGWCLEVLFTSMESVMIHDWRLMAKTSLLMFPIYGMGAVLPEISRLVDWWPGGQRLDWMDGVIRHGALYTVLIFMERNHCICWYGSSVRSAGFAGFVCFTVIRRKFTMS